MTVRLNQTFRGESLRLALQDAIASNCELIDCAIHIAEPREVSIFCSTFIKTTIEVGKTCNKSFHGCLFDSCRFRGKFYNCLFGDDWPDCNLKAGLRNCDFAEASV